MSALTEGDIVVLVSGSPRLCVEKIVSHDVSCVWINEGIVHRDTFNAVLLRKWEAGSSDDRGARSGGFKGGDRGGDRGGFKGGDRGKGGFKGGDRDDKPRKKFEGKSYDSPGKDKKFFRKD